MKNALIVVGVSILILACTGPATAQEIELSPEMKVWEPILGKWSGEEEIRESPSGNWTKNSSEWEIRSGGFFLEIRGTSGIGGSSWIEVIGYDPLQSGYISSSFLSDGARAFVTAMDWSGTTLNLSWTLVTADREVQVRRNTWEHSADFKLVTGTFERFTDGEWWVCRKVKGTKVE